MLSDNVVEIMMGPMTPRPTGNPLVESSAPRPRARGLVHGLVGDLSRRIQDRELSPGDRLPTEAEIVRAFGVSRTVVREAMSQLQAAGLVETRHGIGTFVLATPAPGIFRLEPSDMAASVDVLAVLELRISLETEAAGLAAMRRTEAHLRVMSEALADFERHIADAGDGVGGDFRFHLEIARATGNPYFVDIMTHLGTKLIPRTRLQTVREPAERADYLARVNREHAEILAALVRQDPDSARAAMRVHLTNSRERLRLARLLAQATAAVV